MPLTYTPTKHHVDLWGEEQGQVKGPGKGSNELREEMQSGEAGTHIPCFSVGRKWGLPACHFQPGSYGAKHPISLSLWNVHRYLPQQGGRLAYNEAMASAYGRLGDTHGTKWSCCR